MENIRAEQDQDITDEQAQRLLNLRLNTSGNFSSQQRQEIMNEAQNKGNVRMPEKF